jgi:hypothetical protein
MPFTISHAAAALPFRRTGLVMSAVVAGSFAPDFEYFLGQHGAFGHKMPGIVIFDLPLAFAVLWLFHHYAKEPLSACMPQGARQRMILGSRSLSINSISRVFLIAASIMIGITTHILWDSFTHPGYWLTKNWHFLDETVNYRWIGARPWYEVFQYGSSILGLVIIFLWYIRWHRTTLPVFSPSTLRSPTVDRIAIASAFAIALIAAIIKGLIGGIPDGLHGIQRFMTEAVVTGIATFWIEVLIYGFIRSWAQSTREVTRTPAAK